MNHNRFEPHNINMNHGAVEPQHEHMNQEYTENHRWCVSQYRVVPQKILRVNRILNPKLNSRVIQVLKPIR